MPSSTLTPYYLPGDQVTHPSLPGKTLVVKRMKQTKVEVLDASDMSSGRGWTPYIVHLSYATDGQGNRLPRLTLPAAPAQPAANRPRTGQVIRLTRAYKHWTTEDLMVVLSVNQTTVSAVKLGGETNPGVRIGFNGFTVVDVSTLTLAV